MEAAMISFMFALFLIGGRKKHGRIEQRNPSKRSIVSAGACSAPVFNFNLLM